ncbi:histidinol dehydrogenase [Bacteroidota bacterium]
MNVEVIYNPPRKSWQEILKRPVQNFKKLRKIVKPIIKKVKQNGDKALRHFAFEYDHVELEDILVSEAEMMNAVSNINSDLKDAIYQAYKNIETFHYRQKVPEMVVETMPGVICSRRSVPIQKIGLYIPGGTAPLFSSILMLAIPARIAGSKEVVLCTPCDKDGNVNPVILYTANLCGIQKVAKVGGAHAIAAMAYGTNSIPKVDKIFGPGNQYVTMAKQLVSLRGVAIDMPAGPSEVLVLADKSADPEFVASDLLSQAEHGPDSQVILVTTDKKLPKKVIEEIERHLTNLPRKDIIIRSLEHAKAIVVENEIEAIELSNTYSPEHLIIAMKNKDLIKDLVVNAGSVFLGHYSPEAVGDYASGTNHTLPTYGYASAYSGVSLDSYYKKITYQELTQEGLENIGNTVQLMAEAENLDAHKLAISVRLKKK